MSSRGCSSTKSAQPDFPDRRFRPFFLDNPVRRLLSPPKSILKGRITRGMIVADLGSGPGYLTVPAAEMVGQEGRIYAVDSDAKSIATLIEKAKRKGLSGTIDARVSSATCLPFIPDGIVDLIIAKGLICCMSDHGGALREIHRMLKTSGVAYFSVTKLGSKKDARWAGREEWGKILAEFDVQENGEGITNRWAWVAKAASDSQTNIAFNPLNRDGE